MSKKILISVLFFTTALVYSQELPELVTDRPDITESAVTVPNGYWQVETGFSYEFQKYSENSITLENKNLHLGSTLFRYGISENMELRFGGEYFCGEATINSVSQTTQGLDGLVVGSKYNFFNDENGIIINRFACLLEFQLPFGNQDLRPQNIEPVFSIAAGKSFSKNLELTVNIGLSNLGNIGKSDYFYSGSFGMDLSERWGMFLEYFGDSQSGIYPQNNFDFGFTYLMKENIQLDSFAGTNVNKDNTDWFCGVGMSFRLPR